MFDDKAVLKTKEVGGNERLCAAARVAAVYNDEIAIGKRNAHFVLPAGRQRGDEVTEPLSARRYKRVMLNIIWREIPLKRPKITISKGSREYFNNDRFLLCGIQVKVPHFVSLGGCIVTLAERDVESFEHQRFICFLDGLSDFPLGGDPFAARPVICMTRLLQITDVRFDPEEQGGDVGGAFLAERREAVRHVRGNDRIAR